MDAWKEARDIYKTRGLALFFGAGVSARLGLPAWDGLLAAVGARVRGENGAAVNRMRDAGMSLPAIASLLEAAADERHRRNPEKDPPFVELVREELYREIHTTLGLKKKEIPPAKLQEFVTKVRQDNPTLAAAAALCVSPSDSGFIPNQAIHAVVNMNFDDLFTTFIRGRYRRRIGDSYIVRVTERGSHSADPMGLITCYHPHGRLSFDNSAGSGKETPDSLVLTEQSFFNFFNQPNALFSYTMLFLLREYHALFIGMSFRDENIRRLLHYSASERIEHYRKEKAGKWKAMNDDERQGFDQKARRKAVRHFAVFQRKCFEGIIAEWETSLSLLGVRALWVDDWSELSQQFGLMYGPKWELVY